MSFVPVDELLVFGCSEDFLEGQLCLFWQSQIHLIYLFILNTHYLNIIKDRPRKSLRQKCFMAQLSSRDSRTSVPDTALGQCLICNTLYMYIVHIVGSNNADHLVILLCCLHFSDSLQMKERKAKEKSLCQIFLLLTNDSIGYILFSIATQPGHSDQIQNL